MGREVGREGDERGGDKRGRDEMERERGWGARRGRADRMRWRARADIPFVGEMVGE